MFHLKQIIKEGIENCHAFLFRTYNNKFNLYSLVLKTKYSFSKSLLKFLFVEKRIRATSPGVDHEGTA